MKPKVSKCSCVALESSTGRVFDPHLTLAGEQIPFTGNEPVHVLGGIIQIPNNLHRPREHIKQKLTILMSRVDAVPVIRKQKL